MTNTQLSMVVKAPSEYLTLHVFVEGCMSTAPDIDRLFGANLFNLAGLIVAGSRFEDAPDFSTFRVAPGPHFTVSGECNTVI